VGVGGWVFGGMCVWVGVFVGVSLGLLFFVVVVFVFGFGFGFWICDGLVCGLVAGCLGLRFFLWWGWFGGCGGGVACVVI
ncbi:hypothetical protein DVA80_21235, partial [Acinetobacter baumannii]